MFKRMMTMIHAGISSVVLAGCTTEPAPSADGPTITLHVDGMVKRQNIT